MKENGQEENTGKDSLNKAAQFLKGQTLPIKNVCLFDCDTRREPTCENNVYIRTIKSYMNSKGIKRGIENALILDGIEITQFYQEKERVGEYGEHSKISEFMKMECCDYICSIEDTEKLKIVLLRLKETIDMLVEIFR